MSRKINIEVETWVKHMLTRAARQKGMNLREWISYVGVKEAEKDLGIPAEEFRERGKNE